MNYCASVKYDSLNRDPRAAASHILVCSHDPSLLETRQLVLERVGFSVTAVSELEHVEGVVAERPVDVCVLCQTLSTEECETILAKTRVVRPAVKFVVITAHESQCADIAAEGDTILDGFVFPQILVAEVQRLAGLSPAA